jgi:hypothetical protein
MLCSFSTEPESKIVHLICCYTIEWSNVILYGEYKLNRDLVK